MYECVIVCVYVCPCLCVHVGHGMFVGLQGQLGGVFSLLPSLHATELV